MKIVLIGAGSFVFGPSVLSQSILDHRLGGMEMVLFDPDREVLDRMVGVGQRMARDAGVSASIRSAPSRATALDGADFVLCSAARQIHQRFAVDVAISQRHDPHHLISEFGGVAGISYSLRQIALIEEICRDILAICPRAILLNVANPLPRVCQAAHEMGVKTMGFCSASLQAYDMVGQALGRPAARFPFSPARQELRLSIGGLNHFCWVLGVNDATSGADLYPRLRRDSKSSGQPRADLALRQTGYLLVPYDDHTKDFLYPSPGVDNRKSPGHGSAEERQRRLQLLASVADGSRDWDVLLQSPAWERPVDVIAGLATGRPGKLHSINLINSGQIAALPGNIFVETAATVDAAGVKPALLDLPDSLLPYCRRTALVTQTIVSSARRRDRHQVRLAVELDPTILDKNAGFAAMEECIDAHADVLPNYP